jgi:hypothetical protein
MACEVLCLLRAGFADGSAAGPRTPHELDVTISILAADVS